MIKFWVDHNPVGQPRHRVSTVRGHARLYLPSKHPVHGFKKAIRAAFPKQRKVANAIGIEVIAWFSRPNSKVWKTKPMLGEWHTSKPDVDNILKAVLDALNGLAWGDDCQIASAKITKRVCSGDEVRGVWVLIEELSE